MEYPDLRALLYSDPEAEYYFNVLPDYARDQIRTRGSCINSLNDLKDYAQNILRGDD